MTSLGMLESEAIANWDNKEEAETWEDVVENTIGMITESMVLVIISENCQLWDLSVACEEETTTLSQVTYNVLYKHIKGILESYIELKE